MAREATAARFVEAYVAEVFEAEQGMASRLFSGGVTLEEFERESANQGYSAAVLLDDQGRLIASQPANPDLVGQVITERYEHLKAATLGVPTVSGVVPSAVRGDLVVAFAVPFETPAGRRVYSGANFVTDTPITPFVHNAVPFRSAEVYLVDRTGTVVASNRAEAAGESLMQFRKPVALVQGDRGRAVADGHRHFVVQGDVEGTSWRLVFVVDETELFSPITGAGSHVLRWLALGAFFLLGVGALLVLYRYLLQRARLVDSEARHRAVLDTANDAFIGMGEQGQVTDWNAAATRLLGWTPHEAIGRQLADLIIPEEHREAHRVGTEQFVETGHTSRSGDSVELAAVRRDGSVVDVEVMLSRVRTDTGWQFYAFLRDITERLHHQAQLESLALSDPLTGVANRRAAIDRLEQALAAASRRDAAVAVVYVDVDKFKVINDRHGHTVGDGVLRTVAERLRLTFRLEDTVARMGGDEFVVICENLGATNNYQVMVDRARHALAQPYVIEGQRYDVTASVGFAMSSVDSTVERLIDLADAQMYDAKATREAFAAVVRRS